MTKHIAAPIAEVAAASVSIAPAYGLGYRATVAAPICGPDTERLSQDEREFRYENVNRPFHFFKILVFLLVDSEKAAF